MKGIGLNGVPGNGAQNQSRLCRYGLSEDDGVIKTNVIGGSEECKHVAKYFPFETALELGLQ